MQATLSYLCSSPPRLPLHDVIPTPYISTSLPPIPRKPLKQLKKHSNKHLNFIQTPFKMSTHPTQTPLSTTTAPTQTTTTTTTTHHTPNNGGLSQKAHSALAAAHGTGEAIRGHFNSAVDGAFGEVCPPSHLAFPPRLPQRDPGVLHAREMNAKLTPVVVERRPEEFAC